MKLKDYLKKNAKRQVIMDFDGTIAKMDINWDLWKKEVSNFLGQFDQTFVVSEFDWKKIHGLQNTYIEKYGVDFRKQLVELNRKIEGGTLRGYTKNELLMDFILKNTVYILHLWSSNDSQTVLPILNELGITEKFTQIVTRDLVEYIKPHHHGFGKVNVKGHPKSEYVLIGDSEADRDAAKSAGIDFLQVDELD